MTSEELQTAKELTIAALQQSGTSVNFLRLEESSEKVTKLFHDICKAVIEAKKY